MIIKKIDIENFGKFSGRSLEFKPGFNLIFGKNEDGKSTLMSFIKLLFYGNCSGKSQDISKNIRKKYQPWSGLPMSGAAEFESKGEFFRLHKEFKKTSASDTTTIINLENGEKYSVPPTSEPGQHFFDMDLGEFERSVFIGNYGGFSSDASADSLAMRITNLSVSGDEAFSQNTIRKRLSDAIEELVSKNGKKGILVEERNTFEKLQAELEQLLLHKESQFSLMADISTLQNEISQLETALENHSEAQKLAIAQKSLVAFNALMEKYQQLEPLKKELTEYGLSEPELRKLVFDGNQLKKRIAESYSAVSPDNTEFISDNEFSHILDIKKQIASLDEDFEYINGSIRRTESKLSEAVESTKKKNRLISQLCLGISALSAIFAAFSLTAKHFLLVTALSAVIFLICLTLFFVFGNKAKKAHNSIEVRLAKQEFEGALRLLSFYREDISQKTSEQLFENCSVKKQNLVRHINERLSYHGCSSIEELSKKTVSANNLHIASAADTANRIKDEFTELLAVIRPFESYEQADRMFSHIENILNRFDSLQHDIETLSNTIVHGKISPDFVKSQIDVLTDVINNTKASSELSETNPSQIKEELNRKRQLLGDLQSRLSLSEADENQLAARIQLSKEKLREYSDRYKSLCIASEAMDAATSEMSKGLGSQLSKKTGKYLAKMSDEKYSEVFVSRDLNVETRADSTQPFHQWKYLSSGAIDRVYLALRLAATDIIAEKHNPLPLFLDDILAQYDDESCESTLKFLKQYFEESGSVSQVFFFTCHKHIAEMAKNIIGNINEIKL